MYDAPGSMPASQKQKEERRDKQENGEEEIKRGKFKGGEDGDGEKREEQTQTQLPSPPLGLLSLAGRGNTHMC